MYNIDELSGAMCQNCKKLLQKHCGKDKFGEYVIKPVGYPRLCEDCLNEKLDGIIRRKKW